MTTHTDLIARLRKSGISNPIRYKEARIIADALEAQDTLIAAQQAQMYADRRQALVWRDQVAALTKERDDCVSDREAYIRHIGASEALLSAAQADNARLRGVLKTIDETYEEGVKPGPLLATYCSTVAHAALALPADDSALMERLKQERECVYVEMFNQGYINKQSLQQLQGA